MKPDKSDFPFEFNKVTLSADLEFERFVNQSRALSLFRRNASTWELLLLLAEADGVSDVGVYNTLARVETNYLGMSALLKFIRERREDGLLHFQEHEKRNRWRVRLNERVHAELMQALTLRNRRLKEAGICNGSDPDPATAGD